MPETFYDYLCRYPEIFSWYQTLTPERASSFEVSTRQKLEAGQDVAVQIEPLRLRDDCCYASEAPVFVLYPPIDGFVPLQPSWIGVSARPTFFNRNYSVFVPYHCFKEYANCLETVDLRAAQIRAVRILKYLNEDDPSCNCAAENWRSYRQALVRYGIYIAEEYVERGGSNKVLEYLKPFVRRREWNKPSWVYDERELKQHRSHLMWRGVRRVVAYEIHQIDPSICHFLTPYTWTTLQHCDEHIMCALRNEIDRQDYRRVRSRPTNFYSQYNWDVSACKGNF